MHSFYTITDTREQLPWELKNKLIIGNEYKKLDTGDYSIVGLEDKFTIDRKASVAEIAQNINQKRFYRELQRMSIIPMAYILIEARKDDVQGYPYTTNLPQSVKKKIRTNGNYILMKISQIEKDYGVKFLYCINREIAQDIAIDLMINAMETYG